MRVALLFLLFLSAVFGENLKNDSLKSANLEDKTLSKSLNLTKIDDLNESKISPLDGDLDQISAQISEANKTKILLNEYKSDIAKIDSEISTSVWLVQYQNYENYQNLLKEKESLETQISKTKDSEKKADLESKARVLGEQIQLLKEYDNMPFAKMLETKEMDEYTKIRSPFGILPSLSHIQQILDEKDEYLKSLEILSLTTKSLKEKKEILKSMSALSPDDANLSSEIKKLSLMITELETAENLGKTTYEVYAKRIDDRVSQVRADITIQIKRGINILILIGFIILISMFFKYIAKKSVKDNERFYTVNKALNFINFTLILIVVLFAYIDNVSYFVTFLGFASAGLAIAMKDMFMSMLGWCVIMVGGTFRVGDRIMVRKGNGDVYLGDVVDISLLRMTVYEDVTFISYTKNRRAGRMIFVPNNYIFTELISNYTHSGMKTVWDGIDILLTFDSNHKKAVHIIKNIARQYSEGYTGMAKKQMNRLRSQYSIKNPSVEPRVFTLFEPYGINISVWYMASSYAPLALRSTISAEILDSIKNEPDIEIAYPKQSVYMGEGSHRESFDGFKSFRAKNSIKCVDEL